MHDRRTFKFRLEEHELLETRIPINKGGYSVGALWCCFPLSFMAFDKVLLHQATSMHAHESGVCLVFPSCGLTSGVVSTLG